MKLPAFFLFVLLLLVANNADDSINNHKDCGANGSSTSQQCLPAISTDAKIQHYPEHLDEPIVRLCATISQLMYDATVTSKLKENNRVGNAKYIMNQLLQQRIANTPFENHRTLEVSILDHGIVMPGLASFWKTTTPFAIVLTDDAIILAWRGTISLNEILSDISIQSFVPQRWKDLDGIEAQQSFYTKLMRNIKSHKRTIENLVKGGRRKIYLTGHSLGGGIAQLAHVELTLPGGFLDPFLEAREVEIDTVTFSAPTSIALSSNSNDKGHHHLKDHVAPFMTNIIFSSDVVPHCYSHLSFVNDFSEEFYERLKNDTNSTLLFNAVSWFIDFHKNILQTDLDKRQKFLKYRHIGKIVHYDNEDTKPTLYRDRGNNNLLLDDKDKQVVADSGDTKWFETLGYTTGSTDLLTIHMFLISGSGMAFPPE